MANQSTIMTSNRPIEASSSVMVTLDQFLHHAGIIAIQGESYRLKGAACKDPNRTV